MGFREDLEKRRLEIEAASKSAPASGDFRNQIEARRQELINEAQHPADRTTSGPANFTGGFNQSLAGMVDLPAKLGDAVAQMLGLDPADPKALQATERLMNNLGINTTPDPNALATKMGSTTFNTAVGSAATLAAGPALAASPLQGAVGNTMRMIGQGIQEAPGFVAASDLATVPGQVLGGELGKKVGEGAGQPQVGEALGTIAGGLASGNGLTALLKLGRSAGKTVSELGSTVKDMVFPPKEKAPIHPQATNPNSWHAFSQDQIQSDLTRVDDAINAAKKSIDPGKPVNEASRLVRDRLNQAEEIGRKIENDYWERVPKEGVVDATGLRDEALAIRGQARDVSPEQVPDSYINRILTLTDPKKGGLANQPMTVQQLLGLRKDLLRAQRSRLPGMAVNKDLNANLYRLAEATMDTLHAGIPDSVPLDQARAYSKQLNDLFTRGGVRDINAQRAVGDYSLPGEDVGRTLLGNQDSVQQVADISQKGLVNPGGLRVKFPNVENAFTDYLKAEFTHRLGDGVAGEAAALRWQRENSGQFGALVKGSTELQDAADVVATQAAKRSEIVKSDIAKYVQMDPAVAIRKVFSTTNPQESVREILATIGKDTDALEGFRSSVVDHLLDLSSGTVRGERTLSAERFNNILKNPKYSNALKEALGSEAFGRLERIAQLAKIMSNPERSRNPLAAATSLGARLIGAFVGRRIVPGTIQGPAIGSGILRAYAEKLFETTPVNVLIQRAILDPRWERLLKIRTPATPGDAQRAAKAIRRLTVGVAAGEKYLGGQDDRP